MPNDLGNLRIVVNLRENALANNRVLFHLPSLLKRERPWFFQQTRWQTDLPDVVHQSAHVRQPLLFVRQAKAASDISSVVSNRC